MSSDLLTNVWYVAMLSSEVSPGRSKAVQIAHRQLIFSRSSDGKVTVRDAHEGQNRKAIPVKDENGVIWVFVGDDMDRQFDSPGLLPARIKSDQKLSMHHQLIYGCGFDKSVTGLIDPAHGPYVHRSWFWRTEAKLKNKSKVFVPSPFGFEMEKHSPSDNSKVYYLFGGSPKTEITFSLPGIRTETIEIGKTTIHSVTAMTPIDDDRTQVFQLLYWNNPWITLTKPIFKIFAKVFLQQDSDVLTKLHESRVPMNKWIYIKDADTLARWYMSVKEEWELASVEKRSFKNPIEKTELRWRT